MNDSTLHPTMSTPQEADLLQYGAVSPLAIAALLLGLASFLAVFSLLLLVVPVLAVLVAAFALVRIAGSDGALIGRTAAVIGLVAALLFGSIAVSTVISRNRTLEREAKEFGDAWLELVLEGDLQRAYQLHLAAKDRQLPGSSLADYYAGNKEAQTDLNTFFAEPQAKELLALDEDVELQSQAVESTQIDKLEHIAVRYRSLPGAKKRIDFMLVVERAATDSGGIWRLVQVAEPKDKS